MKITIYKNMHNKHDKGKVTHPLIFNNSNANVVLCSFTYSQYIVYLSFSKQKVNKDDSTDGVIFFLTSQSDDLVKDRHMHPLTCLGPSVPPSAQCESDVLP